MFVWGHFEDLGDFVMRSLLFSSYKLERFIVHSPQGHNYIGQKDMKSMPPVPICKEDDGTEGRRKNNALPAS